MESVGRTNAVLSSSNNSISEMKMVCYLGKSEIEARVFKHLAPVTLTKIERGLPLGGRLNFYEKNFAYILTDVVAGEEKSKLDVKKGAVAFMPAGSTICFFLEDTRSYKPMNILGQVEEGGIEILQNARRGDSLRIVSITH